MTRIRLKAGMTFFLMQVFNYGLIVYSYRMVAEDNLFQTCMLDFVYSSFSFFVIKKIVKSEDDTYFTWFCFATGSTLGTYLGMMAARIFV